MIRPSPQIGFSQRVRVEWLDLTANLVLAGSDKAAITAELQRTLKTKVSVGGNAKRGNREKVISILNKVWVTVPTRLTAFRDDGLALVSSAPGNVRIALHWGMVMAVYPFWGVVAENVGRLLKVQGVCVAAHAQRRLRERYGERETVSRAVRRVIRSFVDWGVLKETNARGLYERGFTVELNGVEPAALLLEASLHSRSLTAAYLSDLLQHPSLFPFVFPFISGDRLAAANPRLEAFPQGVDQELIVLRKGRGGP